MSLSTAQAAPTTRTALSGSKASWATQAHRTGASDQSETVNFRVYLQGRDDAGAQAYATAVSTPGSALYKHFLTPAQYRAKYAPTASQVAALKQWLRSQGLSVGYTPANNRYVEAHGSVATAGKAFGTTFSQYTYRGKSLRSNDSELSVPSDVGGVQAVIGLDDSMALVEHDVVPPAPVFVNAQPCSAYWGEKTVANTATPDGTKLPSTPSAFSPCGYAGTQLQGAYGVKQAIASGNDGKGVTVAVIDAYASPTAAQDLEAYSAKHGLPSTKGLFKEQVAPGTYNRAVNSKQDPQGWAGEETLDLEAVHTTAPGANILYVGAPNNYRDMDATLNHVVDSHSADIITNSYGYGGEALPQGYIKPQVDAQVQAAAEGISIFFSSGDSGDETGGDSSVAPTPDWPASSPWVTAVGGTSLGVTKDDSRQFELGWETGRSTLVNGAWSPATYQYGSGGGTSRLFAQPAYQKGVVPDALSKTYGGAAQRVVPDVSALGDPTTGTAVGQTQTGVDDADGYSYTARWFDDDEPLTIHVRPAYDDVTGVGSPDGQAWLDAVTK
ncbi:hypothetical protein VV01_01375 [Luteipulveratus halotolerans]|uniref:Peptidase S53 domain-containing protein n=1 Tax=Luteipulveratus halotolerans TaxID=1631356 RepID=A0A0L6CNL2_9MICO|nr:hypothetical protein VV01_01375 [Luteipulveratus halotolerans]